MIEQSFRRKPEMNRLVWFRGGEKTTFQDLKHARRLHRKCRLEGRLPSNETLEPSRKIALEIPRDIGEDGTVVLLYHLGEKMRDGMVIVRVNSEKCLGGITPTLEQFVDGSIRFPGITKPILQRYVDSRNFSGSENLRQDFVLIEAEDCVLWIGKILCLMRVRAGGLEEELARVQYYEGIPPKDAVDWMLNCVSLRWARRPDSPEDDSTVKFSKWFDIVPVGAIRGKCHVASIDYDLQGISKRFQWHERCFYVNRFYYDTLAKPLRGDDVNGELQHSCRDEEIG